MRACPFCGFSPVTIAAGECPRCHSGLSGEQATEGEEGGTRLESVADIRRWVEQERPPALPPDRSQDRPQDAAVAFRPLHRPPMALLCVLDDGGGGGEWIRIRSQELVIGRSEGDLLVPHDGSLSTRHLKIHRTLVKDQFVWRVKDLDSTNGVFARVSAALLKHGQEILIGSHRFRFDDGSHGEAPQTTANGSASADRKVTQGWQVLSAADVSGASPSIVELTASGEGGRVPLVDDEHLIGTDAARCSVTVKDDPFVSRLHARLHRDQEGRWQIQDAKSCNGTWLRISEISVRSTGEFQAGEQRFLVRIPGDENQAAG